MKRKLIALLLTLAMLVTSMAALSGSLAASAAAATRGDLNGDDSIDMKDVLLLRKFIAGIGELSNETAADVNDDGSVDMKDVLLLRKYIASMDVSLAPMPEASEEPSDEPSADEPSADEPSVDSSADEPVGSADELIPDQITMAYYDKDCTQYGLTWHTYKRSGAPTVQLVRGATTDAADFADATAIAGDSTKYVTETMPYDYETNTFEFTSQKKADDYVHRAVLKDLDYNTSYSYRVGDADADVWSAIATFTTRPETVTDFSFIEITDTQSKVNLTDSYIYMRTALEKAYTQVENPAFILHGGDFVEASSLLNLWRNMLNGNEDFLMRTPLMMVCGNHDSTYKNGEYEQIKHFNVGVDADSQNSIIGVYYSYDYGNAHFVVLNSNSTSKRTDGTEDNVSLDQKQFEWLKADLEANTKEWTIVTEHHPLFAPILNANDEKPVRQEQLLKLLNDNHVDLFIQSHEHLYMRTYPMDSNAQPIKTTPTVTEDGVTYLKDPTAPIFFMAGKTGKGGDAPYGDYDPAPFAKIATGKESSYSIINIKGNRLTVTANYVEGGQIKTYETFGILHSAG